MILILLAPSPTPSRVDLLETVEVFGCDLGQTRLVHRCQPDRHHHLLATRVDDHLGAALRVDRGAVVDRAYNLHLLVLLLLFALLRAEHRLEYAALLAELRCLRVAVHTLDAAVGGQGATFAQMVRLVRLMVS